MALRMRSTGCCKRACIAMGTCCLTHLTCRDIKRVTRCACHCRSHSC